VRALQGRIAALSPHLDDAALSVGAALWSAARAGAAVSVVTVLAGDPASTLLAGRWDRRAGFATAGEAARVRRQEDARACRILGARPVWLPFADEQYERAPDEEIWTELAPIVNRANVVLIPGFPLVHPDHAWLTALVCDRLPSASLALYVEQPYAMIVRRQLSAPPPGRAGTLGAEVEWEALRPGFRAWLAKQRAARAYASQLVAFARPAQRVPLWIARYEREAGGELVGWVRSS